PTLYISTPDLYDSITTQTHHNHHHTGVLVATTYPTSKVMIRYAATISCVIRNTIWFVFESCRTAPFTRRRIGSRCGSRSGSAATASDTGAKVSNPFAAVHGEPSSRAFACRSRAVMSKNTLYPPTSVIALYAGTSRPPVPRITASSVSTSTRFD